MLGGDSFLPTDFQALSFTSPQMPAAGETATGACTLRITIIEWDRGTAKKFCEPEKHRQPDKAESQKTKCPRQKLTQAFWL
jgi:hypothetical protein